MLSEVEGGSGGSLVTGSKVLEEEVSGSGDGTLCPGEGTVPEGEAELREAMVDGGLLRVHFSVTASTLQGGMGRAVSSQGPARLNVWILALLCSLSTRLRSPHANLKLYLV